MEHNEGQKQTKKNEIKLNYKQKNFPYVCAATVFGAFTHTHCSGTSVSKGFWFFFKQKNNCHIFFFYEIKKEIF